MGFRKLKLVSLLVVFLFLMSPIVTYGFSYNNSLREGDRFSWIVKLETGGSIRLNIDTSAISNLVITVSIENIYEEDLQLKASILGTNDFWLYTAFEHFLSSYSSRSYFLLNLLFLPEGVLDLIDYYGYNVDVRSDEVRFTSGLHTIVYDTRGVLKSLEIRSSTSINENLVSVSRIMNISTIIAISVVALVTLISLMVTLMIIRRKKAKKAKRKKKTVKQTKDYLEKEKLEIEEYEPLEPTAFTLAREISVQKKPFFFTYGFHWGTLFTIIIFVLFYFFFTFDKNYKIRAGFILSINDIFIYGFPYIYDHLEFIAYRNFRLSFTALFIAICFIGAGLLILYKQPFEEEFLVKQQARILFSAAGFEVLAFCLDVSGYSLLISDNLNANPIALWIAAQVCEMLTLILLFVCIIRFRNNYKQKSTQKFQTSINMVLSSIIFMILMSIIFCMLINVMWMGASYGSEAVITSLVIIGYLFNSISQTLLILAASLLLLKYFKEDPDTSKIVSITKWIIYYQIISIIFSNLIEYLFNFNNNLELETFTPLFLLSKFTILAKLLIEYSSYFLIFMGTYSIIKTNYLTKTKDIEEIVMVEDTKDEDKSPVIVKPLVLFMCPLCRYPLTDKKEKCMSCGAKIDYSSIKILEEEVGKK